MIIRRMAILLIDYVNPLSETYCNPMPRRRMSTIVLIYYVGTLCEFQIG